MKRPDRKVERRNVNFAQRIVTEIWQESACETNPYVTQNCSCHGYDLLELMQKRSFVDVLYLLFKGDLPSAGQRQLLECLMIGFINPGPRHPATRAAMTAGVGRTDPAHILPIGLNVLSGQHLGTADVEKAMKFQTENLERTAEDLVADQLATADRDESGPSPLPGFGRRFGTRDSLPQQIAEALSEKEAAGPHLTWGCRLASALQPQQAGWLATGVVAAVLNDLGFDPRTGSTLFQLISAPGLLAHGLELSRRSITAMPFPEDDHYIIEED